jgi:hypothetical protein
MISIFEEYMLLCDMEEFVVTWDAFLGTRQVWFNQPFDKECLADRISPQKLAKLDVDKICAQMKNLRSKAESFYIADELVDILYEEYYTLNTNMNAIVKEVNAAILTESQQNLQDNNQNSG